MNSFKQCLDWIKDGYKVNGKKIQLKKNHREIAWSFWKKKDEDIVNSMEIVTLNLHIPAKAEHIATVRSDLSLLAKELGFNKEKEEDLIISAGEACVNVIQHAYKNNHLNSNMMNIRYLLYGNRLAVVLQDHGKGFDAHFVQRYVRGVDVKKPERIGLGIFLIKTLMDEVKYESSNDEGTSVTMVKYR